MNIYDFITKAIQSDKTSHAYIINGEENKAKSLMDYMAKGVNCLSGAGKPCQTCSSCRKISDHNHPDVSVIAAEGASIGIDPIRQLQKMIYIKPYEGRKRVNTICQGDKMTVQAQNCLLKVLEEPPGTGIILISSANLSNLLPTVVSRCQILKLNAGGRIPDHGLYREMTICLMEEGFIQASVAMEAFLKDNGKSAEDFFDLLLMQLRDILVLKVAQNKHLLYIKDNEEFALKAASRFTLAKVDRLINAVARAREALKHNANVQLAMEVLLLEIQEV